MSAGLVVYLTTIAVLASVLGWFLQRDLKRATAWRTLTLRLTVDVTAFVEAMREVQQAVEAMAGRMRWRPGGEEWRP